MSWETIERPTATKQVPAGISVHVMEIGLHHARMVGIVWNGAPDWFAGGKTVSVQIGRDEHVGSLRISKGGVAVVLPRNSNIRNNTPRVLAKAWPDVPGPTPSILCTHEMDGDAVIITLPWASQSKVEASKPTQSVAQVRPLTPAPRPVLATPPAARAAVAGITAANGPPVIASKETVLRWGQDRGIGHGTSEPDVPAINAKRRQLGLAPFEVEQPRRGARAG